MRSSPRRVPSQKKLPSSSTAGMRKPSSDGPRLATYPPENAAALLMCVFLLFVFSAPQEQGARGDALTRGHEAGLGPVDLGRRGAAHLTDPFVDEVEAVHVRLGEPAPGGVHRQRSLLPLEVAVLGHGTGLAALAESVALERQQDERREGVVDLRYGDVLGPERRVRPQAPGARPGG